MKKKMSLLLCFFALFGQTRDHDLFAGVPIGVAPTHFSSIYDVSSCDYLWRILPSLGPSDAVIFDIDKVLVVGADTMHRGTSLQRRALRQNIKILPPLKRARVESAAIAQRKRMLVDVKMPLLIRLLQNRGVKTCALTRGCPGRFELISHLEDCRLRELKHLGIDFSVSFPALQPYTFHHLSWNGHHPLFKRGILFSAHCNKGAVLLAFLRHINWMPSSIVFVDNNYNNIVAVQHAAALIGVPFTGLLYKAAYEIPGTFEPALAAFQIQYLIDHEIVLDDDQARDLLYAQYRKSNN